MSEISSISGPQRFTSQLRVSLEATQQKSVINTSPGISELEQFEIEMAQINQAFGLVKEIRAALESALQKLSN